MPHIRALSVRDMTESPFKTTEFLKSLAFGKENLLQPRRGRTKTIYATGSDRCQNLSSRASNRTQSAN